jgi:hypothetical protein
VNRTVSGEWCASILIFVLILGIFEHAYSLLGEVALYVAVLVVAVVGFTVLYSGSVGGTQIEGGENQAIAITQVVESVVAAMSGGGAEGVASEL